MAKPKGWVKRNRAFLNTPTSGCMAGVSWQVMLSYHKDYKELVNAKKENRDPLPIYMAEMEANININEEGRNQYVSRKADLRPLRVMRKELDAFESACEQALIEAEEYNAAS